MFIHLIASRSQTAGAGQGAALTPANVYDAFCVETKRPTLSDSRQRMIVSASLFSLIEKHDHHTGDDQVARSEVFVAWLIRHGARMADESC